MEKKQIGRPKLYDSASDKLEAFRKRLESAGYMRKEVLVTKETWEQISTLAKENSASVSDTASGLLEYGTRAFVAKKESASIAFSRKQNDAPSAPVSSNSKARPGANPIADFFNKRKALSLAASKVNEDKSSN
ncbi:MAG: hypothetical protein WCH35_09805 [Comamonadaceae bacterium]